MPDLTLTAEMVPEPTWEENVRKWLKASEWDIVRRDVYALYGGRCAICRSVPPKGRLHCHEQWMYDDDAHAQWLVGLIALCAWCHAVKHLRCSEARAEAGTFNLATMIRHFCQVNACATDEYYAHREDAMAQWALRSAHPEWIVGTLIDLEILVGKPLAAHVPRPPHREGVTTL